MISMEQVPPMCRLHDEIHGAGLHRMKVDDMQVAMRVSYAWLAYLGCIQWWRIRW